MVGQIGLCKLLSATASHVFTLVPGSAPGTIVFGVSPYGGAPNAAAPT